MIRWLDSVSFESLHPAMVLAAMRIDTIYEQAGVAECWITSGNDSKHMDGSRHYIGKALDFRTHNLPGDKKERIFQTVRTALGPEFFVDLEDRGTDNEHLHTQFNGTPVTHHPV